MSNFPTARIYVNTWVSDGATSVENPVSTELARLRYENRILRCGAGYEDPAYVARMIWEKDAEINRLKRAEQALKKMIVWENSCVDMNGIIVCPNPDKCACETEMQAMIALGEK